MKANHFPKLTAVSVALLLAGCATSFNSTDEAKSITSKRAADAVRQFDETTKPKLPEVKEKQRDIAKEFIKTQAPRVRGNVNVNASATPFSAILSEIAKSAGLSVAFGEDVDVNRLVTVEFSDAVAEEAIRSTAFLAGYVAVLDKNEKTIYVAKEATYMFKLPAAVFQRMQADFEVGGNPANSGSGGGGSGGGAGASGGGGGGAGGTSLTADFKVKGGMNNQKDGVTTFLQTMAGKNSTVSVNENGLVNVTGNAQSLRRVHEFMKTFSRSAMTQVEIEASVVEVSLSNDFSMGIKWNNVLQTAKYGASIGVDQAAHSAMKGGFDAVEAMAATGGMSLYRTGLSSSSLISALSEYTDVNVMSQPRLLSLNNVPATFFDGTQMPYLGSLEKTTNDKTESVTGEVAFAIDGVSFSVVPNVVDDNTVQISLVPVLSTVQGFDSFLNGQLTAPRQANKQTYMQVLAENGKTLILGGIRHTAESKSTSVAVSTGKKTTTKEIVILLRANVVPPPAFDPIVSEML